MLDAYFRSFAWPPTPLENGEVTWSTGPIGTMPIGLRAKDSRGIRDVEPIGEVRMPLDERKVSVTLRVVR